MIKNTPPMGWNSWNTFGADINEQLIKDTADKMAESGLLTAGYTYLVIDDCWSKKERDENGRLVADPEKFPNGMKAVADYVHSKGLKFGMYSCAGNLTCAGYPGSFEHEFTDAETFASWGVDFLKYDYCYHSNIIHGKYLYRRMGTALKNCGRDILFSACSWGLTIPPNGYAKAAPLCGAQQAILLIRGRRSKALPKSRRAYLPTAARAALTIWICW